MVDRNRTCRNADLRNPFIIQTAMAHRCEPCGGSDDHICRFMRRAVPNLAYGSRMDVLLCTTISKYPWFALAEFQLTVVMGRLRGILILPFHYYSGIVDYYRIWPVSGTAPSSNGESFFMAPLLLDGPVQQNTGNAMRPCLWCSPVWPHRWCFPFIPSCLSISPLPLFPAGIPPSFRLIS